VVVVKEISSPSYSTLEIFKFSDNLKHKNSSIIEIMRAFKKFKNFKFLNRKFGNCSLFYGSSKIITPFWKLVEDVRE
jgi:hypothetical protein